MSNEEIFLLLKAKCKDIGINFRENMYFKFKEFCNAKCNNRVADFSECNFSINSIRIITVILLDTNRLARLDLTRNNIGNFGVEILVNSLKNSKTLVYLNLSSNSITHKGGQKIFSSFIGQQSIIDLNLSSIEGSNRNRITEVGIEDIPLYLNNNHFIETLNLSGNSLKNEGFILICQGLQKNQNLLNLDISNNNINEKGIKKGFDIIISSKISGALVNLNICNNHLTNAGLEILSSNLKIFPNLVSLNLSFCGLEFKGLQNILKTAQHMKKMEYLNVAGNNFETDNFFILKEYFAVFGLKHLNLSRCSLGDSGAHYLGECILANDTLKYLNISGNNITDSAFKSIAAIFKINKSLEYFDCSCNFITNNSARELFKNLVENISLALVSAALLYKELCQYLHTLIAL
jgi:Ran GTPase-activating protein (RanGAP) involved in mRNA processing and transport